MASAKVVLGLAAASLAVATLSHRTLAEKGLPIARPAGAARVVKVVGEDFRFDAPDIIPAGLTEFRFLNKGPSLHHMALLKLTDGKTVDDLRKALATQGPPPAWLHAMGGPNAPDPGSEANVTMRLEPGNYALICFVDLGGAPHFTKGMIRPLRVVPAKNASAGKVKSDAAIDLYDYGFKLSSPIRAGTRVFKVHNGGQQPHEVELVQLAPGASVSDFMNWLQKMDGPPPGKALGGVAGMEVGMTQYFSASLTPGNYALICFLSDAKDGKPHFTHGMVQQITVQ
ncbi:MAG TPA: hypothetical protein VGG76_08905 [Gemmatimonadaceae bacterium]|jgi:hypothetical protein